MVISPTMPAQKSRIRPMDPFRDMRAVADLLELAFGEVLDSSGRQMIREARSWASARYLYQPLQLLTGSMSPLGPGFVWVKDDKIVGHTTLIRSNRRPGVWQIANVAVHPQYQRQGIASELMKHVMELVRRKEGRLVALQVRRESAAVGLYDKLGFEAQGAVTRWKSGKKASLDQLPSPEVIIRRERASDKDAIWRIFASSSMASRGWPDPLSKVDLNPSVFSRLIKSISGESMLRWVAIPTGMERVSSYVDLRRKSGVMTRLSIRSMTGTKGSVVRQMLSTAITEADRRNWQPLFADHPADDPVTDNYLLEAGFKPARTLVLMEYII